MKIASIDPRSPVFVALALLGWLSPSLAAPRDEDIRSKPLRSAAENAAGNVRVAKGFKLDLIYYGAEEDPGLVGGPVRRPEGPADRGRPERQALSPDAAAARPRATRSSPRRSA